MSDKLAEQSTDRIIATQTMQHDMQPQTGVSTDDDDLAEMDSSQPYPFDLDATAW